MSNVLRLAIVDPKDDSREKLKTMLIGMEIVWLEAECSRYEFFPDVVAQSNPDVGVICLDSDPDKAIGPDGKDAQRRARLCLTGRQQQQRRPADTQSHAGRRERVSHLTCEPRRVDGCLGRISQAKFGGTDGKSRNSRIIAVAVRRAGWAARVSL